MDILILLPVLLFSVVIHEVAHALVAKWEGDDTAHRLGRITLNPIPHLDPVGSIAVPLLMFFLMPGGFIFGWAKPVPVNPRNFRNYKLGDIRVSLAGIAANLLLALFCALILGPVVLLERSGTSGVGMILYQVFYFGLYINLILAVFNLIPIPPLDGSHVVAHLLPPRLAMKYREMGRYGLGILMLLVVVLPGGFQTLLKPVEVLMELVRLYLGLWS
jgi:Zn-dependent protease